MNQESERKSQLGLSSTIVSHTGVLLAFLALPGGTDGGTAPPSFAFFEPVSPPRAIQVMAHRGAMRQAPENTARALELSIADTVEWVEVDVRLTKDGQHVLFHDDQLGDKTDGTGRLRDRTLAELRALDAGTKFAPRFAGARILTLAEGLELREVGSTSISIARTSTPPNSPAT